MMSSHDAQAEFSFVKLAFQNQFAQKEDVVACIQRWNSDRSQSLRQLLIKISSLSDADVSLLDQLNQHQSKKNRPALSEDMPTYDSSKKENSSWDESEVDDFLEFLTPVVEVTSAPVSSRPSHDETTGHALDGGNSSSSWDSPDAYPESASSQPRFQIKDLHAQGGLGEVYVAVDGELDREVALKQIRPRFADDPFARERFELEATITGGLEHPGIVPVYGFGKHGDGRPFYAMRFIHGRSMKEEIVKLHRDKEGKRKNPYQDFEFRNLLEQFTNACHAIAYAHSRGVIHRDIKPSNIMLGNFGETLVVDWGLAKCVGRKDQYADFDASTLMPVSGSQASATVHGSTIGTPPFMSPEQANGDLESMGPRSDIYSLGASLYMILTGSAPYGGQSSREVVEAAKKGQFQVPVKRNPLVPKPLNAICCKAMSLKPEDRYEGAEELAKEIQLWMADRPVAAYDDPFSVTAMRWLKHHRTLAVSSILGVTLIAVAASIGAVMIAGERDETRKALDEVKRQQELTADALNTKSLALQQTGSLLDSLSSDLVSDILLQSTELSDADRKFLKNMESHFDQFAGLQPDSIEPLVLANGKFKLAEIQRRLGNSDDALASSEAAIRTYDNAVSTKLTAEQKQLADFRLAKANGFRGLVLSGKKKLTTAAEAFEESQKLLDRMVDENPDNTDYRLELANLLVNKANLLSLQNKSADADNAYNRALTQYKSLESSELAKTPRFLLVRSQGLANRASLLAKDVKTVEKAAEDFRQCAKDFEQLVKLQNQAEHRDYLSNCYNNLGNCLLSMEKFAAAAKEFQRTISLQTKLVDDFPLKEKFKIELGKAYLGLGKSRVLQNRSGAEELLQAKKIFSDATLNSVSNCAPELADTLQVLGTSYTKSNKVLAEQFFNQANELRARITKNGQPGLELSLLVLATDINWANFLFESGESEKAIAVYLPLLKLQDDSGKAPPAYTRLTLLGIAECYGALDRYDQALPFWTRLSEDYSDPAWQAFELKRAICLADVGKIGEAVTATNSVLLESDLSETAHYDAACVNAVAARRLDRKENAKALGHDADWYREQAMKHLQTAADDGFFKEADFRTNAATDKDLDALRQLDAFKTLCKEHNIATSTDE